MSELNDFLKKQRQLMEKVPHSIAPHALVKLKASLKLMDTLLRYYNSIGGKPWRPIPLSLTVQEGLLRELGEDLGTLKYIHRTRMGSDVDVGSLGILPRQYISGFGVIEESIEYMNSLTDGSGKEHELEELVDQLFFWLEQVALGGFTMKQVAEEYYRKWSVNMERYERAKKGDFGWDDREEKEGL